MSIKSDLICPICKKIFKDPIFFPCHCTFCKKHADELVNQENNNTLIKCQVCNEEFALPKQGFKENTRLKTIIEKDAHLSEEEKSAKRALQSSPAEYERLLGEIATAEKEFESTRYEHFAEIRRNIDLRRENLKLSIDQIAEALIDEAKALENAYTKRIVENNKTGFAPRDFEAKRDELVELFRDPGVLLSAIETSRRELASRLDEAKGKLRQFDAIKHDLKQFKFEKYFELENDFFGRLKSEETGADEQHQILSLTNPDNFDEHNLGIDDQYGYVIEINDDYLRAMNNYGYHE